jgi:hypothetical protein
MGLTLTSAAHTPNDEPATIAIAPASNSVVRDFRTSRRTFISDPQQPNQQSFFEERNSLRVSTRNTFRLAMEELPTGAVRTVNL